jgi:cell wall-associated NlpC family hydrolase
MVTGAAIVAAARGWLGTPWVHQGRSKGQGVDCAGLVIGVAHELGLSTFDVTGYSRQPDGSSLQGYCDAHLDQVLVARPGDVALMRFADEPQHLAIFGDYVHGGLSLVHAYMRARAVVEHGLDDLWRSRVLAVYRFKGVA